jgi:glycosyltransferase involved in cell wall biosynthesis
MSQPKVSICCITYNHEAFIAQTVDSFLMQQTDFEVEIIIGEDCSKDGTRQILLDYQARYPDKIRLLLHDANIGMIPNFYQTLSAATGEYIAICEGDDYWTDPGKLQAQVALMDRHPEYSFCFHRVARRKNDEFVDYLPAGLEDKEQNIHDLIRDWDIVICTMLLRRHMLPGKELMMSSQAGDQSLCYGLAAQGNYYFMGTECMADYRYHPGGITNNPDISWSFERMKTFQALSRYEGKAFKTEIDHKIIELLQPRLSQLRSLPTFPLKLRGYLGFFKELMVHFKGLPLKTRFRLMHTLASGKRTRISQHQRAYSHT